MGLRVQNKNKAIAISRVLSLEKMWKCEKCLKLTEITKNDSKTHKNAQRDGPTNGRTSRRTNKVTYRVACTRPKNVYSFLLGINDFIYVFSNIDVRVWANATKFLEKKETRMLDDNGCPKKLNQYQYKYVQWPGITAEWIKLQSCTVFQIVGNFLAVLGLMYFSNKFWDWPRYDF